MNSLDERYLGQQSQVSDDSDSEEGFLGRAFYNPREYEEQEEYFNEESNYREYIADAINGNDVAAIASEDVPQLPHTFAVPSVEMLTMLRGKGYHMYDLDLSALFSREVSSLTLRQTNSLFEILQAYNLWKAMDDLMFATQKYNQAAFWFLLANDAPVDYDFYLKHTKDHLFTRWFLQHTELSFNELQNAIRDDAYNALFVLELLLDRKKSQLTPANLADVVLTVAQRDFEAMMSSMKDLFEKHEIPFPIREIARYLVVLGEYRQFRNLEYFLQLFPEALQDPELMLVAATIPENHRADDFWTKFIIDLLLQSGVRLDVKALHRERKHIRNWIWKRIAPHLEEQV